MGVARSQDFVTQLHSVLHRAIESASFADADRRLARSITPFHRGVSKKVSFAFEHLVQEQDRGCESSDLQVS